MSLRREFWNYPTVSKLLFDRKSVDNKMGVPKTQGRINIIEP